MHDAMLAAQRDLYNRAMALWGIDADDPSPTTAMSGFLRCLYESPVKKNVYYID